jgi:hypothetical protein
MIELKNAELKVQDKNLVVEFCGTMNLSSIICAEYVYDQIGRLLIDQINKNLIESVNLKK